MQSDKQSVNVVFIGREGMYAALHNDYARSSSTAFIVASVTYRGLVRDEEAMTRVGDKIDAAAKDKISSADAVVIICADADELKEYVKKLDIKLANLKNLVVIANEKERTLQRSLKEDSKELPFVFIEASSDPKKPEESAESRFQKTLLSLYPENKREQLQQEFKTPPKGNSPAVATPSTSPQKNPNADLGQKQTAIQGMANDIEQCAGSIKAKVQEDIPLNARKIFVDQVMEELQPLKQRFDAVIKEYKERADKHPEVKADLNRLVDESLEKANIAYNAAVDAQKKLDEEIAAAAKREADEIAEAARVKAEREAAIAAAVEARRQRLAKLEDEKIHSIVAFEAQEGITLDFLEEYRVSAMGNGTPDVFCVVFDPDQTANCEDHLRATVEHIKRFQKEKNPHLRVVFLRAVPYVSSPEFSDYNDKEMIERLGIENPVIVDNLVQFKDKAGYGQPVVFKKTDEHIERADVPQGGPSVLVDAMRPDEHVVIHDAPNKKRKREANPHRFTWATIKHARYERKELLANNYNLNWLELTRLSVEKNCGTSRFIEERAGDQLNQVERAKIDQVRFKVVIDLLRLLDKEERRWKPKFWTYVTKYADDPYLVKRDAQRKLIYHVAEKLFQELENNPAEELNFQMVNRVLAEQSAIYPKDGHVRKGIIKAISDNFPAEIRDMIFFPKEADRMEAVAPVAPRVGGVK